MWELHKWLIERQFLAHQRLPIFIKNKVVVQDNLLILSVEPLEPGKGREVDNKIKGGAIPKEFIPVLKKVY